MSLKGFGSEGILAENLKFPSLCISNWNLSTWNKDDFLLCKCNVNLAAQFGSPWDGVGGCYCTGFKIISSLTSNWIKSLKGLKAIDALNHISWVGWKCPPLCISPWDSPITVLCVTSKQSLACIKFLECAFQQIYFIFGLYFYTRVNLIPVS